MAVAVSAPKGCRSAFYGAEFGFELVPSRRAECAIIRVLDGILEIISNVGCL